MSARPALSLWWEAARPRTLSAAVAPVLAASALAYQQGGFTGLPAVLCLGFALLIQIGTNYANDYFDFKKGADTAERVGPRRAVAAGLIAPQTMWRATLLVMAVAFGLGLGLLPYGGWPLLVVGLTSIACGIAYTGGPYPLAYHGWGDVFVFVFFGLVAVGATYFVQVGQVSTEALWLGAGLGALSTNILVVNNYRDIATDRSAGKRTLAVRFGPRFARTQFAAGHGLWLGVVGVLTLRGALPVIAGVLLAAISIALGYRQLLRLHAAETPAELIMLLGATGRHVALMALLVSIGLVI